MLIRRLLPCLAAGVSLTLLVMAGTASAAARHTARVSIADDGTQGNEDSLAPAISADGTLVAFESLASTLVLEDTNNVRDVFVRNRSTHTTSQVSVATGGAEGNGPSDEPAISANGRYVAFASTATNLVAGDDNAHSDVFLRDRTLHKTFLVSVSSGGTQGDGDSFSPSVSDDGRYVAFASEADNLAGNTSGHTNVFVRDRTLHRTYLVSPAAGGGAADGDSTLPSISGDGRYVAFQSVADDIVNGDTNTSMDVFVRDRSTHQTFRVSVSSSGAQGNEDSGHPSITPDGRYVAFYSYADDLVPGDANATADVFVRDRTKHTTTRVSIPTGGGEGDEASLNPSISGDGSRVVFESTATNLVPGDGNGLQDVFIRNRSARTTTRVSVAAVGGDSDGTSQSAVISRDDRYVGFASGADDLVAEDTNGAFDVFVRGTYA